VIDLKVTTVGGPEIARALAQADTGIRDDIRDELARIGEEIVERARSLAPRRTGGLQARIIWYFGTRGNYAVKGQKGRKATQTRDVKWKDGRIRFEVMPTGKVAHLMERGVHASFNQRTGRRTGKGASVRGRHEIGPHAGEAMQGPDYRYARTLNIAPRPFFMPAVESVGGAAGVNARLQAKIDQLAQRLNAGGA
jgi:hypothetical protein